nr:MAG: hypothetical protein BECKMB1821G_GA0114241_100122 [Candidatus Kentron sp. MB]
MFVFSCGIVTAQEISPALESDIHGILGEFENCTQKDGLSRITDGIGLRLDQLIQSIFGISPRAAPEELAVAWFGAFEESRYERIVEDLRRDIPDQREWSKRLAQAEEDIAYLERITDIEIEIALIRRLDAGLSAEKRAGECGKVLADLLMKVAEQRDKAQAWLRLIRFHVRKEKGLRHSEGLRKRADEAWDRLQESRDTLDGYRQ